MFDKIVNQIKSHALVKKACIFFAAFAVTLSVMGGVFGFQPDSGISAVSTVYAAEKALKADETTAEETSAEPKKAKKAKAEETTEEEEPSEPKKAKKAKVEEKSVKSEEETQEDKPKKESAKKEETEKTDENESVKEDETSESVFVYSEEIPMSRELQEYTYQKCVERGVEYELVLAIIWRESRFDVNALSFNANGTSDNGIMQINDVNKQWLYERHGINDLMDPYQNIDAGTVMMGTLTEKYGAHGAMMAYQYGEAGMARRLKQGYTTSTAIEAAYLQRDYYKQLTLLV